MIVEQALIQAEQVFLGWDRPVVDLAVEHLLGQIEKQQATADWVDLSDLVVVVPTRNAGRRLREALAIAVSDKGGALLPPQVKVPEDFLRSELGTKRVASSTAAQLAWIEELRAIDLDEYDVLFPVKPPEQGFSWACKVADELISARSALAEGGLLVADLLNAGRFEDLPERDRWQEIGKLEHRVIERLKRAGLEEPEAAKITVAQTWQVPDEVRKIILLALPDPLQLALDAITAGVREREMEVEVCIHAPESLQQAFDGWGRPVAAFWQQRILADLENGHIYLAADAEGQKEGVLGFLRNRREQEEMAEHAVAVGCADGDVLPVLKRALQDAGVEVFDPDGEPFRKHSLYHFVLSFSKLLRENRFRDFLELLRNPVWLDSLALQSAAFTKKCDESEQGRVGFDAAGLLRVFDSLNERVMPGSLDDAAEALRRDRDRDDPYHRPLPEQWLSLDAVTLMLKRFHNEPFAEAFISLLRDWFGNRQVRSNEADAQLLSSIAERSRSLAEEMSLVMGGDGRVDAGEIFELLIEALAEQRYYPGDRHASDLELQGWLELPWEVADDLVVSGFNDGLVPAAVIGDMFLPESARVVIGLKNNEDRFARDLYLLESMLAWRLPQGHSVKLVLGKLSSGGDLLKPSRLLFQCEDQVLAARALRLFAEEVELSGAKEAVPAWNLSWKLQPPFDREFLVDKKPNSLSGTAFTAFLSCPFRFILKRILRMEDVNTKKMEMDAMDFGSLCHQALEILAAGSDLAEESSYDVVNKALEAALRAELRERFGERPPATVLMQAEVAINRLQLAARHHVDALNEGWQVIATEKVFGKGDEQWLLAGMPVTGTIDRIEKNAEGQYRLIDYKTSGKASSAFEAHLKPLGRGETAEDYPDWMLYELPEDGKTYRWVNLQLPVYCLWAQRHLVEEADQALVNCAYVNLPKALGDGGYSPWPGGMDASLLRSAKTCAEGVIEEVKRGQFWPPTAKVKYDDFERLGFPDFIASLDEVAFEKVFSVSKSESDVKGGE